jgi:hypothetical protein
MKKEDKIWVENIAEMALNSWKEVRKVEEDKRPLSRDNVKDIVEVFGGTLCNGEETKIIWNKYTSRFEISCPSQDTSFDYLSVLHELGHAFFDINALKEGEVFSCEGVDVNDDKAWLFARTIGMPRKQFEQVLLDNLMENGTYNVEAVAKEYDVDYFQVLLRGEELNIWE